MAGETRRQLQRRREAHGAASLPASLVCCAKALCRPPGPDEAPRSMAPSPAEQDRVDLSGSAKGAPPPLRDARAACAALAQTPLGRVAPGRVALGLGHGRCSLRSSSTISRDSFSEALMPAIIAAQMFFVLPVRSGRTSLLGQTVVLLVLFVSMTCMAGVRMCQVGVSPAGSSFFVFYGTATMAVFLLSRLAARWPLLAARWRVSVSRAFEDTQDDARRPRVLTCLLLAIALVEHLLSVLSLLVPVLQRCGGEGRAWSVYKTYFSIRFPWVLELFPFSLPISIILIYLNFTCTFLWNFIDVLLIVVSFLLAERFKKFNAFLAKAKGKNYSAHWWEEVRETYNHLSSLTKYLDDHISSIVLLSFASNLYFICLQLLNNMTRSHEHDGALSYFYFYFSFAWIVARTSLVSMNAARIYEESMFPMEVLFCVPSKSFCTEVQRFQVQVTTDTVALSGCRFFWVTRSLLLTLAGTVATYEIVLVQFHAGKDKSRIAVFDCLL